MRCMDQFHKLRTDQHSRYAGAQGRVDAHYDFAMQGPIKAGGLALALGMHAEGVHWAALGLGMHAEGVHWIGECTVYRVPTKTNV